MSLVQLFDNYIAKLDAHKINGTLTPKEYLAKAKQEARFLYVFQQSIYNDRLDRFAAVRRRSKSPGDYRQFDTAVKTAKETLKGKKLVSNDPLLPKTENSEKPIENGGAEK